MRFTTLITALSLCVLCILIDPTSGFGRILDKDIIYSPEQIEYIQLSTARCPGNTILWLGDRRCYREGEQGPCNIGRVLVLHPLYLKPLCKDVALE